MTDLACKYGLHRITVSKRAKAEDWHTEREMFARRVDRARQEMKVETLASAGAKFDTDCFAVAERMRAMVMAKMAAAVETGPDGRAVVNISAHELNALSQAAKTIQAIGKVALGEQPDNLNGASGGGVSGLLALMEVEEEDPPSVH